MASPFFYNNSSGYSFYISLFSFILREPHSTNISPTPYNFSLEIRLFFAHYDYDSTETWSIIYSLSRNITDLFKVSSYPPGAVLVSKDTTNILINRFIIFQSNISILPLHYPPNLVLFCHPPPPRFFKAPLQYHSNLVLFCYPSPFL